MRIKVILKKDLKNFGRRGDIKYVAEGYARNHLVPRGFAVLANQDMLEELDSELRIREDFASSELMRVQDVAERVENLDIYIKAKADEEGTLYKGISASNVKEALSDMGFNVPEGSVNLERPIKQVGEHSLVLEFDHGLEANIRLVVEKEEG